MSDSEKLDATLAAIERVRAIHQKALDDEFTGKPAAYCPNCMSYWPCRTIAALDGAPEPSHGVALIAAERARQVTEEGYDAEHDKGHAEQLVAAALSYASAGRREIQGCTPGQLFIWPWADRSWKPTGDPRRDLTKAGALIAAAIDSLPVGGESSGVAE